MSTDNKSSKPTDNNVASIAKEPSKITTKEASQSQQEQSRSDDKTKTTQYEEMSEIEDPIEFWNQWKIRKHKCMNMGDGQGRVCNCFEGMGSVM